MDKKQEPTKVETGATHPTIEELARWSKEHEKDFVPDSPMGPNVLGEFRSDNVARTMRLGLRCGHILAKEKK